MIGSLQRSFAIPVVGVLALALASCSSAPEETAEAASAAPSAVADQATAPAPAKEIPITTTSEDARNLYLQGRDLVEKIRFTDGNKYFHQALEKDPDFALAWLAAANSSATMKSSSKSSVFESSGCTFVRSDAMSGCCIFTAKRMPPWSA